MKVQNILKYILQKSKKDYISIGKCNKYPGQVRGLHMVPLVGSKCPIGFLESYTTSLNILLRTLNLTWPKFAVIFVNITHLVISFNGRIVFWSTQIKP